MVTLIDTSLAAQNAAIAAESMGLEFVILVEFEITLMRYVNS